MASSGCAFGKVLVHRQHTAGAPFAGRHLGDGELRDDATTFVEFSIRAPGVAGHESVQVAGLQGQEFVLVGHVEGLVVLAFRGKADFAGKGHPFGLILFGFGPEGELLAEKRLRVVAVELVEVVADDKVVGAAQVVHGRQ